MCSAFRDVLRTILCQHVICFESFQARILAKQFKELPAKEVRKWVKKAEEDKARYQEEMKDYVPNERVAASKKANKKQKKDPSAPKRSMSSYFLFSIDVRPKIKAQHPEASFGDVARLISDAFKKLSDKEKKYWEKRAAEDKARYNREMEEYRG